MASVTIALGLSHMARGQDAAPAQDRAATRLTPTAHPPVPVTVSQYWLVPDRSRTGARSKAEQTALDRFARGAKLVAAGDFAAGLPLVNGAGLSETVLAGYAQYYTGVALIGLSRFREADEVLAALTRSDPRGYLEEASPQRVAEAALGRSDAERAVDLLDDLADEEALVARESVLLRLGRAAERAGDVNRALSAYRRIYYELPTAAEAADADMAIRRLETPDRIPPDRFKRDLDRAERLFDVRRWAQARAAFEPLLKVARGDDAERIALRLAEADYYLDRFRASRDRLVPLVDDSSHEEEARFFHLSATRGLGEHTTYVRLANGLVEDHPDSTWAEETLNNLASHYITVNEDAEADRVFRQLLRSFPKGRHAERAAWRIGWRAYRAGNFREAAETFEQAAFAFPRADYRPAWLYWSGRAHTQLDEPAIAASRYGIAIADYENSYYGRLAIEAMGPNDVQRVAAVLRQPATTDSVPTDALIRELIACQLYDDALREVQYAQRKWGDSAQLQATAAFVRQSQGATLKAEERFTAIRGAITTMRRAYPQFMAAGGSELPPEVLRVIFPLDYWSLITKYSKLHGLDPYLIAALMAQESTFTAEIRSSANAIGLMQLIPSTGRRYARKLNIRNFSTRSLTNPETNVRLGTLYFKELMDRFGGAHYALAGYNAGENRVDRWIAERPPLPADEFVEEIPFSETQSYVKRILGTAEDYRYLYGGGRLDPNAPLSASAAPGGSTSRPGAAPSGTDAPARAPASQPSRSTPAERPGPG